MAPFTEEDQQLAQKLMKDLLPSRHRRMRNSQVISASIDSTLRMPDSVNKGFGIRKMEPREIRDQHLAQTQFQLNAKPQDGQHLQLISYCLGIAPSKYHMDVSHINKKLMALFEEPKS
jgi:hypothetical protein